MDERSTNSNYYLFSRETPFKNDQFSIELLGDLVCTPEYYKHSHNHEAIEFCLITEGKGAFFLGDRKFEVEPGHIFLTHPRQLHRSQADPYDPYRMYYMVFNIYDDPVFSAMYRQLAEMDKHLVKDQYNMAHFFSLLVAELIMKGEGSEAAIKSLFHTIIVYLHRNFTVDRLAVNRQISSREKLIQKIVMLADQRFDQKLDLDRIASDVGYSPSYVSRVFKDQMGMKLSTYWNKTRMGHARRLINEEEAKTLQDIALSLGFEDYHYFSRLYKSIYGHSPRSERAMTK